MMKATAGAHKSKVTYPSNCHRGSCGRDGCSYIKEAKGVRALRAGTEESPSATAASSPGTAFATVAEV
jgi:hypothetical protein